MVGTTAMAKTAAAVGTAAPKVVKKGAIITAEQKTAIVVTKTFRNSSIASFNRKEKYF